MQIGFWDGHLKIVNADRFYGWTLMKIVNADRFLCMDGFNCRAL